VSDTLDKKYRPRLFSDLVGQEKVAFQLSSVLRNGNIAHSYLFAGPHGCGKTSAARIFAMGLNCLSTQGPTDVPCGVCNSCKAIASGKDSLSVTEVDSASNNGVDFARELVQTAALSAMGRYKVVILDEAHQLTNSAQNSLLKLFEEPPKNLVIILATTEPEKLLPTVRSRFQTFQFRKATTTALVGLVSDIATKEGINLVPGASEVIVKLTGGNLRDATVLLGQLSVYPEVTVNDVYETKGGVPPSKLLPLVGSIVSKDTKQAILQWRSILDLSTPSDALNGLLEMFLNLKHITLLRDDAKELVDLPEEDYQTLFKISSKSWDTDKVFPSLRKEVGSLSRSGGDRQKSMFIEATIADMCNSFPFEVPQSIPVTAPPKATYRVDKPVEVKTSAPKGDGPSSEELLKSLAFMHKARLKAQLVGVNGGIIRVKSKSACEPILVHIETAYTKLGYSGLKVTLEETDA
jgi:DNA polymerase III subunit gamma/tau